MCCSRPDDMKCLQFYQYVTLDKLFRYESIPLSTIVHRLRCFLPPDKKICCDADLKRYIICQGSYMYNKLIECLSTKPANKKTQGPFPALATLLKGHNVQELYRYVWLCCDSGDNTPLLQGDSWYISYDKCVQRAFECRPRMEVYDGPGSPTCALVVESCCSCNVLRQKSIHMTTMCMDNGSAVELGCFCPCCFNM